MSKGSELGWIGMFSLLRVFINLVVLLVFFLKKLVGKLCLGGIDFLYL